MNIHVFAKIIQRGFLGIIYEVVVSLIFIAAGFLVCAIWWGILR